MKVLSRTWTKQDQLWRALTLMPPPSEIVRQENGDDQYYSMIQSSCHLLAKDTGDVRLKTGYFKLLDSILNSILRGKR